MRGLVQHKILHELENHDPPYKVCWHLRDFTVGLPINEQIAMSILQSRKVLFVFSEHFTESQFCRSELDQALHRFQTTHTRCILPIVLNEDSVPKKLKSMLTYWPLVNLNDAHFLEKITKLLGKLNCMHMATLYEFSDGGSCKILCVVENSALSHTLCTNYKSSSTDDLYHMHHKAIQLGHGKKKQLLFSSCQCRQPNERDS